MERPQGTDFGEALRRAREEASLTPAQLAEATRVPVRCVEALEAENWEAVPPGIIGRGFVRLLAKRLGPAAEALPALYAEARREELPARFAPQEQEFPVALRRPRRGRQLLAAGAVAAVAAAALWMATTPKPEPPPRPAPEAEPAPAPAADAPAVSPAPTEAPPPAAPAAPSGMRLEVLAVAEVWVSVAADDGRADARLMKSGERRTYEAQEGFRVRLGNAGGVRFFWNGEPLKPPGASGQVLELSFPRALERLRP